MLSLPQSPTCPGLFSPSSAADGMLIRIRTPGGIINSRQCYAIANLADDFAAGYVHITNRANLQVREIHKNLSIEVLNILQELGLGSRNLEVDPIRNIMSSPTAGIDSFELIDTRPFVRALDNYFQEHPELAALSPKFSVCFDGGGAVSVGDRLNDIRLLAVVDGGNTYLRLYLCAKDTGVLVKKEEAIALVAALADVYLSYTKQSDRPNYRRPRLKHLLEDWGIESYLKLVTGLTMQGAGSRGLGAGSGGLGMGIHPQRQPNLFYIGITLPLGRLESWQLRGLADLARNYGSETLRLTPWQNLLISDIPNRSIADIQDEISKLGLDCSGTSLYSALVACSGSIGCISSNTDTQTDALKLVAELNQKLSLKQPINIHFSGCEKSCAQHGGSDIALVGTKIQQGDRTVEGYDIYVGVGDSSFGRELYRGVTIVEVPRILERIIKLYQRQQLTGESFGEFANRCHI
ncbi:MAG: precorrin-3B synthase [Cyanomargarita calcarea GSE-NOS-MK-12-04C]|uniref:Precorrin-3B synthase n=1 Tax=Cyanomargarita calcarea GSE-NOS-MK-12-04C TaxID=2839659 RepID=A0A951QH82_9CYAN|nr:precorrin-3B synthase [Cyanomargarita calcarea GSE-NOS-MK-12-04C]